MARVIPAEVNRIYSLSDLDDYCAFIETANLLVTEEVAGSGLSTSRLKQIELYLAAHFAAITVEKGGLKKRKVGESEDEFHSPGINNKGLNSTRFGQQAVALDSSGKLGALTTSTVKARFRVV